MRFYTNPKLCVDIGSASLNPMLRPKYYARSIGEKRVCMCMSMCMYTYQPPPPPPNPSA